MRRQSGQGGDRHAGLHEANPPSSVMRRNLRRSVEGTDGSCVRQEVPVWRSPLLRYRCRRCKSFGILVRFGFITFLVSVISSFVASIAPAAQLKERRAEVTYSVNLNAPAEARHV